MSFTGPIIVLTPGRVGTQSVRTSLANAGEDAIQIHGIGPAADDLAPGLLDYGDEIAAHKVDRMLLAEMHIRRAKLLGMQIRLVSLVRDPIDRAVSEMINRFDAETRDAKIAQMGVQQAAANMSRKFVSKLPRLLAASAKWYRDILPLATGVSVPPHQPGMTHCVFESPFARCLFMATEHLTHLDEALAEFVGRPIPIEIAGRSSDRFQHEAFLRVKLEEVARSSNLDLDRIYDQPVLTATYRPEEIVAFKERWRSKPVERTA